MDSYQTPARVEKGALDLDRSRLKAALAAMKDGPVVVTIERARAGRSTKANAYYWAGPIAEISEHTGFTPDETHELMKALHLPKTLAACDKNGAIVAEMVIGGTTRTLNSQEFGDYVMRVKQWALDKLGVVVPEPTESW